MISKKQYARLSLVVAIPLLLLGWWLAEKELILPRHHVIYCEEFDSHIRCNSLSATKSEADDLLYRNGAVRLWGARLASGFHHPIVTLGHSEIKIIDGQTITLPPTDGGIQRVLRLPPKSIEASAFSSCEISPFADDTKSWGYSCIGGDLIPDSFYFQDEQTNQKFQAARKLIGEQRAKDEKMEVRVLFASLLTPLFFYFLFSAALFLLMKVVKYVIYGRKSGVA
jgi:hypothetical protein